MKLGNLGSKYQNSDGVIFRSMKMKNENTISLKLMLIFTTTLFLRLFISKFISILFKISIISLNVFVLTPKTSSIFV